MSEIQLRRKFFMKEQMLQMGFGVTNGKDRFFEMFYLSEAAQERIIQKKFKKGGLGIILDGIKYCSLWKDGSFYFSEGTSAAQSMDVFSYDAIRDLSFNLIREKRFMTKEEYQHCLRYFYSYISDMIHYMNMDTKKLFLNEEEMGLKRITENVHERTFLEKLLQVLPMLQTMDIPSKRDQYRIQEVLDAATFLLHVSNQYIDPDFSYEKPEVFITEDEILQYLCSGSGFENGKYRIWSFCKEDHLVKEISEFLKNEYGNGGHNSALSGDFFSDANYDSKGIRLTKAGCTVQLSWMEAAKKIRCLIHADCYLTKSEKDTLPLWEQEKLAQKIWAFFDNLPGSIPGPWDEFLYIQDDAKRIKDIIRLMNVFEEEKSMSTYIQDRMDFLSSDSAEYKEGKKLLLELASYQIRLFGKKEVASKKKKFVIPQEPGTQMSIFDFM